MKTREDALRKRDRTSRGYPGFVSEERMAQITADTLQWKSKVMCVKENEPPTYSTLREYVTSDDQTFYCAVCPILNESTLREGVTHRVIDNRFRIAGGKTMRGTPVTLCEPHSLTASWISLIGVPGRWSAEDRGAVTNDIADDRIRYDSSLSVGTSEQRDAHIRRLCASQPLWTNAANHPLFGGTREVERFMKTLEQTLITKCCSGTEASRVSPARRTSADEDSGGTGRYGDTIWVDTVSLSK